MTLVRPAAPRQARIDGADHEPNRAESGRRSADEHADAPSAIQRRASDGASPCGIVRRAGVPERPAGGQRGNERQNNHPKRLALNVRPRIERHLSAVIRRQIAA